MPQINYEEIAVLALNNMIHNSMKHVLILDFSKEIHATGNVYLLFHIVVLTPYFCVKLRKVRSDLFRKIVIQFAKSCIKESVVNKEVRL